MLPLKGNRNNFKIQKKYFEELHCRYSKQIYHYSLRIVGDPDMAKDLTQDAFIKLWEIRDRLEEISDVKSYLYTISKNLLLDHLKNEQFKNDKLKAFPVQFMELRSPQIQYEENELNVIRQNALYSLSETSRTVFLMSREHSLSYNEISQRLGISKVAVKKQMMKALGVLRKKLQPFTDIELIVFLVMISM